MQLVSFQIKNCFGFRDSGQINLQDSKNLIYILGRNSSGKTSFLTALANFSPHLIPQNNMKFQNFNPLTYVPYLLSRYKIEANELSLHSFIGQILGQADQLNTGTVTFTSPEYRKIKAKLTDELALLYQKVFDDINQDGNLYVLRTGTGKYQFSNESDFKDSKVRIMDELPRILTNVPHKLGLQTNTNGQLLVGGGWQPFRLPTPEEIESTLTKWLPKIAWFSQAYSLLDTLPDVIKMEHLIASPNPLTTALIEYLEKPQIERLLQSQNPREWRETRNRLQEKINILIEEVNRGRTANMELLTIDLERTEGMQITAIAGNKFSFYQHLSDNTKFLFAYHLHAKVHNLTGNILLFDEPNNGFHATAQERLLGFLQTLSTNGNLIIVSTHSEHLIDPDHLTGVRLMIGDNEGYLSVRNKWYASTTGRGDFQALRPILDAIGLRYGSNHLTIHNKVIVTEGVTELLYLRAFCQLLNYSKDLHIAPATGDDTIPHVIALLISQGLQFKVVVDTEAKHKTIKDKLQEDYGIPDESICEVEIPRGFPQAKGSGIEDVFSKADFAKLLTTTGHKLENDFDTRSNSEYMKRPKLVPKRVVAHQFNAHIANSSISDFEEETLTNMRRILDFCMNDNWFLL